jgi:hypothetical protein
LLKSINDTVNDNPKEPRYFEDYSKYIHGWGRELVYSAEAKMDEFFDPTNYTFNFLNEINEGHFDYKQDIKHTNVYKNVKYGRQFVIGKHARVGFMVSNTHNDDVWNNTINPLIYGKGI